MNEKLFKYIYIYYFIIIFKIFIFFQKKFPLEYITFLSLRHPDPSLEYIPPISIRVSNLFYGIHLYLLSDTSLSFWIQPSPIYSKAE